MISTHIAHCMVCIASVYIKSVPPDVCICNCLLFASVLTVYDFSLTAEELRLAPLQAMHDTSIRVISCVYELTLYPGIIDTQV